MLSKVKRLGLVIFCSGGAAPPLPVLGVFLGPPGLRRPQGGPDHAEGEPHEDAALPEPAAEGRKDTLETLWTLTRICFYERDFVNTFTRYCILFF